MFLPFKSEIDEALQNSPSLLRKCSICGLVSAFLVLSVYIKSVLRENPVPFSWTAFAVVGIFAASVGIGLGMMLQLKDVVEQRVLSGRRVNSLLLLLFALRGWSAAFWFVALLVLTFIGTIVAIAVLP